MASSQQPGTIPDSTQPSIQKYTYLPFTSPSQIRVFTLHPGPSTAPLRGSLTHIDLAHPPSYEALSYEWGPPIFDQQVFLQTNTATTNTPTAQTFLHITQSLHHALHDLRHEDRPRTIWADALCIDQTNLPERSAQVSLMGRVYRGATRVTTYIGPDDGTTPLALALMYSLLPILANPSSSAVPSIPIPPASDPRCAAFRSLVLKRWAGRCWCAQEFLLNADLVMLSGRHEMPWFLLPSMVQLVATHKLPAYLVPADPLFLGGCLSAMFTMRGAMHLGDRYAPSLLELLVLTYPMRATDVRDKIYSLLGVAADVEALNVKVDYECRVEDLYVDVAKKILEVDRTATLLQWNLGHKNLDLPSWVPDWTAWRPGSVEMMVGKQHRAGGRERPEFSVMEGGRRLEVAGGVVDGISFLSECVGPLFEEDEMDGDGGEEARQKTAQFLDDILAKVPGLSSYTKEVSPKDILARTLTCDMALNDDPAAENHVEFFEAFHASYASCTTTTTTATTDTDNTLDNLSHAFHQNAHKRMRYRRLCITSNQFFGAVPQEAEVGDVICVVQGAKALYVLRPSVRQGQEGMFCLVGPAYVHGLMSGEAVEGKRYAKRAVVLV